MHEKRFYIAPAVNRGRPSLLIRRYIISEQEIQYILDEILKNKKIEIKAIVSFRDPFLAIKRLRELGLLQSKK